MGQQTAEQNEKNLMASLQILDAAMRRVYKSGEPGSRMKLQTLNNAVEYLVTGQITHSRGVANLWAHMPVSYKTSGTRVTIPESEGN